MITSKIRMSDLQLTKISMIFTLFFAMDTVMITGQRNYKIYNCVSTLPDKTKYV